MGKGGREGERTFTHTYTSKHTRKLSLHETGGTFPRVVSHAHAVMLPLASSMTHVLRTPLSRVPRRSLFLHTNPDLTCAPLTQEYIATIAHYVGPSVTCQASCMYYARPLCALPC